MITIGVTGGIGSGKTTVCRMLEGLGARVFYADLEARRLMEDDRRVVREITSAFGSESYVGGRLNRPYLASKVFGDEAEVAKINAIVHPRVFEAFEQARAEARAEGVPMMVKEAALIFETGGKEHLDAVVVVDAPVKKRIDRVSRRDQVEPAAVHARMRHQLQPEELRRRADYVIENSGSTEDLERKVEELYRSLVS